MKKLSDIVISVDGDIIDEKSSELGSAIKAYMYTAIEVSIALKKRSIAKGNSIADFILNWVLEDYASVALDIEDSRINRLDYWPETQDENIMLNKFGPAKVENIDSDRCVVFFIESSQLQDTTKISLSLELFQYFYIEHVLQDMIMCTIYDKSSKNSLIKLLRKANLNTLLCDAYDDNDPIIEYFDSDDILAQLYLKSNITDINNLIKEYMMELNNNLCDFNELFSKFDIDEKVVDDFLIDYGEQVFKLKVEM